MAHFDLLSFWNQLGLHFCSQQQLSFEEYAIVQNDPTQGDKKGNTKETMVTIGAAIVSFSAGGGFTYLEWYLAFIIVILLGIISFLYLGSNWR
eukprot:815251_1